MSFAPEVEAVVAVLDEVDKLIDLAAPFLPEVDVVMPWADQLRALADKLTQAAIAKNPAAAEVAAADAAASAAEDVKFGQPGQGPK